MNAIWARNNSGITANAEKRCCQNNSGRCDHPAGHRESPQSTRPGADLQRFLTHPRHEEDVVVDSQSHEEHERKERDHRIRTGETEDVVEHQRRNAQCRSKREHHGAHEKQRCEKRTQQERENHEHHDDHHGNDECPDPCRGGLRVEVGRSDTTDQCVGALH